MRQLYILNFEVKCLSYVTSFTKYLKTPSPHKETETHASFSLRRITSRLKKKFKINVTIQVKAENDKHTCCSPFTHAHKLLHLSNPSAFFFLFKTVFKYILLAIKINQDKLLSSKPTISRNTEFGFIHVPNINIMK